MAEVDFFARVQRFYPDRHTADVTGVSNGWSLNGVPVLCAFPVSTSTGDVDLPAVDGREIVARVEVVEGAPFITGFLPPQVGQMLFGEGRAVRRHYSDVYSTVSPSGDVELYHPSGTFLRIGANPEHEDLSGADASAAWALSNNVGAPVHVRLQVANSGGVKATLTIAPDGAVTLDARGSVTVVADGGVTLDAPTTTVTGHLEVQQGISASGGSGGGAAAEFAGNISVNGNVDATGTVMDAGGNTNHHSH